MTESQIIGFYIHGVSLNLYTNYSELAAYMEALLPGMVVPPAAAPTFEVHAHWLEGPTERVNYFPDAHPLNGVGKRMEIGTDELVWLDTHRDKEMQLRFRRRGETFLFDMAYCYQPSQSKLKKYPDFRQKKFFDLARYLVHFPVAWHLERTRGMALVHAAAVGDDQQHAILIAGPGGAGKTTTSMALIARTGMQLLTENMLLTDGDKIYPVLEPIRLTEDSLGLLENDLHGLAAMAMPGGLKNKTMFWLPEGRQLQPARPVALFLPQFTPRGFVQPLAEGIASEQIRAANRLTLEINNYYWYTAALDMLWPSPGNSQRQLAAIDRLVAQTPCFALGIDKSQGVEPVVDEILGCLQNGADTLEIGKLRG